MKEIKISSAMIENARIKSKEMGPLRNSIVKGDGNIAGFIGEQGRVFPEGYLMEERRC